MMFRRNNFGSGARALIVLGLAGALMTAHATDAWDHGSPWNLNNNGEALAPGVFGGSTPDWKVTWGSNGVYSYYAGAINWKETSPTLVVSDPVTTFCASLYQDFNVGTAFNTHKWSLSNAWNNGSGSGSNIGMGDGSTVALPTADTSAPGMETADNFLKGAELFGRLYTSVSGNNSKGAALQLAIWKTLYGANATITINGSYDGGNLLADYNTDTGAGLLASLNAADLSHVQWYNYTGAAGGGQGQYTYSVTPGPTPEPVTIALGIAGLGIAARRRMKARRA